LRDSLRWKPWKGSEAIRKSRFSVEQITYALKQVETGVPVAEICRKLGISEQTFYLWKKKYGGMGVVEARRVSQLEDENRHLKQLVADLTLDKHMLQEVLAKKAEALAAQGARAVAGQPVRRELAKGLQCDPPATVDVQLQRPTS
jgi:putative transposase